VNRPVLADRGGRKRAIDPYFAALFAALFRTNTVVRRRELDPMRTLTWPTGKVHRFPTQARSWGCLTRLRGLITVTPAHQPEGERAYRNHPFGTEASDKSVTTASFRKSVRRLAELAYGAASAQIGRPEFFCGFFPSRKCRHARKVSNVRTAELECGHARSWRSRQPGR